MSQIADEHVVRVLARASREFARVRERLIDSDEPTAEEVAAQAADDAAKDAESDSENDDSKDDAKDEDGGRGGVLGGIASVAGAGARLVTGRVHPRHDDWDNADLDTRAQWWTDRFGTAVAAMAALPSSAGLLARAGGLVDAVGAAGQLLVIYAIAHEVGERDTSDQVVVAADIVLGRELDRAQVARMLGETDDDEIADLDAELDEPPAEDPPGLIRRAGRSALLVRRVARQIRSLDNELGNRPQGGFLTRTLRNLPGLGLAGGFLAERSGVRQAGEQARKRFGLTIDT